MVTRRNTLLGGTTLAAAWALGSLFEFAPSPAKAEPSDAPTFRPANIKQELFYQRATQSYLWALPLLNIRAMKEGSEAKFGAGYNVLPIWKKRMSAVTLVTTPNSDVIYAMGYLDLKQDGPMVIEAPPGLQGILDDFWQRPIRMVGQFEGRDWSGDVGLPGPDKGKGGKYLVLPPDYNGDIPTGYFTYRSRTYGVFVFWRGFFQDPKQLDGSVKVMEQTKIYPLGKKASAKPMQFPDASGVPVNMLFARDASAFDMIKSAIDGEYVDPTETDMRGMLAAIGIIKDQPFNPNPADRAILDQAAHRALEMARWTFIEDLGRRPGGKWYTDRQWVNIFPPSPGTPEWVTPTYTDIDIRAGFFSSGYSTSPVMVLNVPGSGAKYPAAFRDADGDAFDGSRAYRLHLPANIPAKLFWSVTVYDLDTMSGLQNGQPFPSLNQMDEPIANPDGSTDIYFGPNAPGAGKNWLATVSGKPFWVALRLYGPEQPFFDQSWKPGDVEKVK
jgi:hypothetical protein